MEKSKRENIVKTVTHGDLIFIKSSGWIGKIIRWVTSSNINHIAFYIGNGLIIESTLGHGVRILPLDVYLDDPESDVSIGKVKEVFDAWTVILHAYTFYGQKYDLFGQIGILLRYLVKKAHLGWLITFFGKNRINQSGVWCSEFIGAIFRSVNITFNDMDITYYSPSDIYNSEKIEIINL